MKNRLILALVLVSSLPAQAGEHPAKNVLHLRIAVFNVFELSREKIDQVDSAGRGIDPQLRAAAEVLQRVRPEIVLVNEIDYDDEKRQNAQLFVERYLAVAQQGQEPLSYPFLFFAPVNTGFPSGLDFNNNGETGDPEDAYGFGRYPGQYGMALLSQWPFDEDGVRTFQKLLWRAQPVNLMPDGRDGKPAWYSPQAAAAFRLSSKSHWDVGIRVGEWTLHVLASHPTPQVFDGEEDRNGRRNYDEIRLWADYLSGGEAAAYLLDDAGRRGGLDAAESFVILGDLNADPVTDAGPHGQPAIRQLLEHPRVRDPVPRGEGGKSVERAYEGLKETRTSKWGRIDYVLPSRDVEVKASGVFWPAPGDPLHRLVAENLSSDHRLVWADVVVPAPES